MSNIKLRKGDCLAAQIDACKGQMLAQMAGNCYEEARALRVEATCCTLLGDYKKSIMLLKKARGLVKLCGLEAGTLERNIRGAEAEVHLLKSEYAEALQILTHLLQNITPEQQPYAFAFTLLNLMKTVLPGLNTGSPDTTSA